MKSLIAAFILISLNAGQALANCNAVKPSRPAILKFCESAKSASCPKCSIGHNEQSFFVSPPLKASIVYSCNNPSVPDIPNAIRMSSVPCPSSRKGQSSEDIGQWLAGFVTEYPKGCGYSMFVSLKTIEKNAPKPPREVPSCGPSMCTSATFYAFTNLVRKLNSQRRLPGGNTAVSELTDPQGKAFKFLNIMARPDQLMKEYNLGEGAVLSNADLKSCSEKGWPHEGDLVQLWRNDGSGHSAIFQGMLYDDSGAVVGLCYWTSNKATRGYAKRCEESKNVRQLIVGRVTI